jgi:hypothetical protein
MSLDFARKTKLSTAIPIMLLAGIMPVVGTCRPCLAKQTQQQQKPTPISEKPTLDLVEKLSQQPELLCTQYLQYILGRPAKRHFVDQTTTVFHWVTAEGGIGTQDCELWETRDANHRLTRSIFKVNLPHSQTSITDIEKKLSGDANTLSTRYPMPPGYPSNVPPGFSPGAANTSYPGSAAPSATAPGAPGSPLASNAASGFGAPGVSGMPLASGVNGPSSAAGISGIAGFPNSPSDSPSSAPSASPSGGPWPTAIGASNGSPTASMPPYSGQPVGNLGSIVNQFPQKIVPRMAAKHLFDQQCRPSLQFSFVPYTNVFYTQAPNTFHVHHCEVVYNGPPLPPPSQNDIALVAQEMRLRALTHHAKDSHNLAVPMLTDHLIDNPGDAEAHYALGLSYQKSSNLNAAISEYQLALRYSNGDQNVSSKATASLQQLQVLPSPNDQLQYHTLRFKQDGQGLTEGDVIATQDRQTFLANGKPPFYSTNAPPLSSAANGTGYGAQATGGVSYGNPSLAYRPASMPPSAPVSTLPPVNQQQPTSFYDRMTYGNNLFPATAPNLPGSSYNPDLEPGF